jgi:hypothetical protein
MSFAGQDAWYPDTPSRQRADKNLDSRGGGGLAFSALIPGRNQMSLE